MKPIIVQHTAGHAGHGGPATALHRLITSDLAGKYSLVVMRQEHAAGGFDIALIKRWVAQLRRIRPDMVHVRGMGNEGFHAALAARIARCPRILVSVHGSVRELTGERTWRRRVVGSVLEPLTLTWATHVATVCRSATDSALVKRAADKLVGVVPNGVPHHAQDPAARDRTRAQLQIASDRIVLVVVSRLSTEKGHLVLADALDLLDARGLHCDLLVVGGGPDRAVIARRYRAVRGSRVHLVGQSDDVFGYLGASDIFVFPTLHENLSNALIEAMSAGLPAVATAVGGNVEVLEAGGGLLVAPGDPVALCDALQRLITSGPADREELGRAARTAASERFSAEAMISGWDRVYTRILAGG